MTVCSETPCAISTLEQFKTRLGTLELIVCAPNIETVEHVCRHVDSHGSDASLNECSRPSAIPVEWQPRRVLLRYSDCTGSLLGVLRRPTDAKVATTSRPTVEAAAGDGR
jgi:hypothetical protein